MAINARLLSASYNVRYNQMHVWSPMNLSTAEIFAKPNGISSICWDGIKKNLHAERLFLH